MEIEIISQTHKEYLDFVVEGLRMWERAENNIEKIEVFNSSIRIEYKENPESITELLSLHENVTNYGLDPFISISDMKNGHTIRYDLE